ncbi:hypothetical protein N9S04_00225 [bacterium]|jgi:hypothetical protein|nr:hypothetical protein [bacterium]|tara:strand:- start:319 stop:534 length:216 start_codon:yes stop_codon:yes gene_type:complete
MSKDIFIPFYRDEDETWLEAAERHADNYNLTDDVEALYYGFIRDGYDDMEAAMSALEELKIPLDGLEEESA